MSYLLAAVLGVAFGAAVVRAGGRPGALLAASIAVVTALACLYLASTGGR